MQSVRSVGVSSARTALRASVRAPVPVRAAHAHSAPLKSLPPRPELPANATLAQRFQHNMWYKRHPDYEGVEAYMRYYMPHNYNLVYFVLGLYGSIGLLMSMKSKAGAKAAVRDAEKPSMPDYHTALVKSSDIPEFASEEWVNFIQEEGNLEKWIMAGVDAESK